MKVGDMVKVTRYIALGPKNAVPTGAIGQIVAPYGTSCWVVVVPGYPSGDKTRTPPDAWHLGEHDLELPATLPVNKTAASASMSKRISMQQLLDEALARAINRN